jgi:acyl-CoA thioester hydrolase
VTLTLGHMSVRRPPFKFAAYTRVGFSDTDAQGIVYYGRYLPYFDLARVEYHRHLDLLVTDRGEHDFVMRVASVLYEAPARFDDLLEVFIRTTRIGRTSVTNEFCAVRTDDDELMCTAEQTLVLVDHGGRRPVPVPGGYRDAIVGFEGADVEVAVAR